MASGGFLIQRAGGFIHQNDLGIHGQRAGQAESLLLTDREPQSGFVQAVLYLVPKSRLAQGLFGSFRPVGFLDLTEVAHAKDHVLVNARGKHDRLLKQHADAGAERVHIRVWRSYGPSVKRHLALNAQVWREVNQAIETAQQRALARAGGSDDAKDLPGRDGKVNVADQQSIACAHRQGLRLQNWRTCGDERRFSRAQWFRHGIEYRHMGQNFQIASTCQREAALALPAGLSLMFSVIQYLTDSVNASKGE